MTLGTVATAYEAYDLMLAYGNKKRKAKWDKLLFQGFMAGFWVAVFGHCCTVASGAFYDPDNKMSAGITKLIYGTIFPGAFVAVIWTGTELFTGNTVAMTTLLLSERGKCWCALLRVWSLSLLGNIVGAVWGAFILSYCGGLFSTPGPLQGHLYNMATHKLHHGWGEIVALGIGCNSLVCLATWVTLCTHDGAGKILAIWFCIAAFAMGGFEHVVANFYTLSAALMCGLPDTLGSVIVYNWLPVLLGNVLAGTFFTGTMWWYGFRGHHTAFSYKYQQQDNCKNEGLATREMSKIGGHGSEGKESTTDSTDHGKKTSTSSSKDTSFTAPENLV